MTKKSKKPYLRVKTNKTTGLEGKWEARQAEAELRKQEVRLREQTTISGMKPANFWKD